MKLTKVFLLPVLWFAAHRTTAQTPSEIFDPKSEMTWLGLDFTGAKFIGDRERLGSQSDVHRMMTAWNKLMIEEPEKYDLAKALHRPSLKQAIDVTIAHNEQLDLSASLESAGNTHLTKEDIWHIVSSYDFGSQSGIGVLFVVESFNKLTQEASVWVTFVNINTKEMLFTNRVTDKPSGIGVRNYWASAIYKMMRTINSDYSKWKRKYEG